MLHNICGATNFEHLRTINGKIYPTFKAAAISMGLLESDEEWIECLKEASNILTGSQLRHLFSAIILFCEPTDPGNLFNLFKKELSADFSYKTRNLNADPKIIYNEALLYLESILNSQNKSKNYF